MTQQKQTLTLTDKHGRKTTVCGDTLIGAFKNALDEIYEADCGEAPYSTGWKHAVNEIRAPKLVHSVFGDARIRALGHLNRYISQLHDEARLHLLTIHNINTTGWRRIHFVQYLHNDPDPPLRVG